MADYQKSTTVLVEPARLFDYLSDVENLPRYLPRLTSATPAGDGTVSVTARIEPDDGPPREVQGEAWIRVIEAGRRLQWGATGPNDYHGELDVDSADQGRTATLTIRLHTERAEGEQVEQGLIEALAGLERAIEEVDGS